MGLQLPGDEEQSSASGTYHEAKAAHREPNVRAMEPMNRREFAIFLPITVLVLWFGVYPASLLDLMAGSIQVVLDTVSSSGVSLLAQN